MLSYICRKWNGTTKREIDEKVRNRQISEKTGGKVRNRRKKWETDFKKKVTNRQKSEKETKKVGNDAVQQSKGKMKRRLETTLNRQVIQYFGKCLCQWPHTKATHLINTWEFFKLLYGILLVRTFGTQLLHQTEFCVPLLHELFCKTEPRNSVSLQPFYYRG